MSGRLTRKRCPDGYRSLKNGNCVPIDNLPNNEDNTNKDTFNTSPPPIPLPTILTTQNKTKKILRRQCSKGKQFDEKKGECVDIPPFTETIPITNTLSTSPPVFPEVNTGFSGNLYTEQEINENKNELINKIEDLPQPQDVKNTTELTTSLKPIQKTKKKRQPILYRSIKPQKNEGEIPTATPATKKIRNPAGLLSRPLKIKKENITELPIKTILDILPPEKINNKNVAEDVSEHVAEDVAEDVAEEVAEDVSEEVAEEDVGENKYDMLYPDLDDPNFSYKIAQMAEFAYHSYEADILPIEERADILCKAKFELMPHQIFIKNFLSANTPYKCMLLYNMIGSGKTCTAIGVATETLEYMKKIGVNEKVWVVASPNVQGNFKLQLFDERRLKQIPNPVNPTTFIWNLETCIGASLLNEINPDSLNPLPRDKVISNINSLITQKYTFMGYGQLGKYLEYTIKRNTHLAETEKQMHEIEIKNIMRAFNNRLIIIDEVHNIRLADDNKNKTVASLLMKVAKYAVGMRLLLLSATPMFNSYKEIIWLTNLMNLNDKREPVETSQIFDSLGNFRESGDTGKENGRDLLARKLNGYISYVRGENPYSFPYRIYPDLFAPNNVFGSTTIKYPMVQMNGKKIASPLKYVKVFCNKMNADNYQTKVYNYVIETMKKQTFDFITNTGVMREMPTFANMENFGYTILQTPLEALNMCYPLPEMETVLNANISTPLPAEGTERNPLLPENEIYQNSGKALIQQCVGKRGLSTIMKFKLVESPVPLKTQFEYKPDILEKYGRIFNRENLPKYSHKIATICDYIRKSDGIILLYSQFINGGVIPLALALEEMGFSRYSSETTTSLFKKAPHEPVDYRMRTRKEVADQNKTFYQAKYIMITGDRGLSLNNNADVKYATNAENANGSRVKVIIISKTGSESIDFKNIRQVHILEPWYNMNRMEQIVGRGVRNLSHCELPFIKRNVQIFYHCSILPDEKEESADLYVYRLAEKKAVQIGKVSRLLKETAVDCVLNIGQTKFTAERLFKLEENQNIKQELATGDIIHFKVGDKPFTEMCDYMENCEYTCRNNNEINKKELNYALYGSNYAKANIYHIAMRIKQLFKEKYAYKREELIRTLNYQKNYPIDEIFFTLTFFINKLDTLTDEYGRTGYLINRGEFYVFQPVEITNENASMIERIIPVNYKHANIKVEVPSTFSLNEEKNKKMGEIDSGDMFINSLETNYADKDEYENEYQEKKINIVKTKDDIINEIWENVKLATTPIYEISAKDKNWFKHCATVFEHLQIVYEISKNQLIEYIVYHALDIMDETEKLILLNACYGSSSITFVGMNEPDKEYIVKCVRKYFDLKIRRLSSGQMGIVLTHYNTTTLYINGKDGWELGDEHDEAEFINLIVNMVVSPRVMNDLIGFLADFKSKECVFKVKDITQKRNNIGAKCDNAGKLDILRFLNQIVDEKDMYTTKNMVNVKQPGLCVLLEIIMREYTRIGKNGKVYFMDGETAILSNVAQI